MASTGLETEHLSTADQLLCPDPAGLAAAAAAVAAGQAQKHLRTASGAADVGEGGHQF